MNISFHRVVVASLITVVVGGLAGAPAAGASPRSSSLTVDQARLLTIGVLRTQVIYDQYLSNTASRVVSGTQARTASGRVRAGETYELGAENFPPSDDGYRFARLDGTLDARWTGRVTATDGVATSAQYRVTVGSTTEVTADRIPDATGFDSRVRLQRGAALAEKFTYELLDAAEPDGFYRYTTEGSTTPATARIEVSGVAYTALVKADFANDITLSPDRTATGGGVSTEFRTTALLNGPYGARRLFVEVHVTQGPQGRQLLYQDVRIDGKQYDLNLDPEQL